MKTVAEILKTVDERLKDLIIKNINDPFANGVGEGFFSEPCPSLKELIQRAFVWGNTDQGHEFWANLSTEL